MSRHHGQHVVLFVEYAAFASRYDERRKRTFYRVAGEIARGWVLSDDGRPIAAHRPAIDELIGRGPPSIEHGYKLLGFHACADGEHLVYFSVAGPVSGSGGRCRVDPRSPMLTAEWVS